MIIEFKQDDNKKVLEFLKNNPDIKYKERTAFDCFLASEIKECKDIYKDTLGEYTLNLIANEVEEELMNESIEIISQPFYRKVMQFADIIDRPTVAVAHISNNISVLLKAIHSGVEDVATVVYGKDVYECEIRYDKCESDGGYITIGELELTMQDFMRV